MENSLRLDYSAKKLKEWRQITKLKVSTYKQDTKLTSAKTKDE